MQPFLENNHVISQMVYKNPLYQRQQTYFCIIKQFKHNHLISQSVWVGGGWYEVPTLKQYEFKLIRGRLSDT